MALVWLSHPLSPETPAYGGGKGLEVLEERRIVKGQSTNQTVWRIPNHVGTHVDVPFHVVVAGKKLHEFEPDFWRVDRICLIDHAAKRGELIAPDAVIPHLKPGTQAVMIRTGWESRRKHDDYWKNNPGISVELCEALRAFGGIRFLGFDFISLSAYGHADRTVGKRAHLALLGDGIGEPICILEDMRLSPLSAAVNWMLVSPLIVFGADGAPCTVWGEV